MRGYELIVKRLNWAGSASTFYEDRVYTVSLRYPGRRDGDPPLVAFVDLEAAALCTTLLSMAYGPMYASLWRRT